MLGGLPGFACARGSAFDAGAARCARTARKARPPFPARGAFLGEGLLCPRPGDAAAAGAAPPNAPVAAAPLTAITPFRGSSLKPKSLPKQVRSYLPSPRGLVVTVLGAQATDLQGLSLEAPLQLQVDVLCCVA